MVKIKRVYEPANVEDGLRVLVDRLWPRGVSKERAKLDAWLKEIAPSDALRKWFSHDPARWDEFRARYSEELQRNSSALTKLKEMAETGTVTLLFAARDEAHNEAVVIRDEIGEQKKGE